MTWTPSTEEVRNCYIDSVESHVEPTNREELVAEFNRWLQGELQKARDSVWDVA